MKAIVAEYSFREADGVFPVSSGNRELKKSKKSCKSCLHKNIK
jgi:hypothetical protein